MTIPDPTEVGRLLDEIASKMAVVKAEREKIAERTKPLEHERTTLKDKVEESQEECNKDVTYAHEQEAEVYAVYLKAKQQWESYREMSRQQHRDRVAGINARVQEIRTALWDDQIADRKLQEEMNSLERQWDQALRRQKDAANYASVEERLNRLTMGAPWREWAKDHQIEGARKLSYRGRMILADTMGLGKTLTSIIALDMIRAMTSEADAEHPVVIETN